MNEIANGATADWPRGWWLQPKTTRYKCCNTHKGHSVPAGHKLYLTGKPGEVYCEQHAPVPLPKAGP